MDQSFTKEVEDEANSYFQRIYNHPPNPTISIDEVLEMLKKFKDSPVKKERVSNSSIQLKKKIFFCFTPRQGIIHVHCTRFLFKC